MVTIMRDGNHHRDGDYPRDCGHPKDFYHPVTFLKDCNNSKGQGRLMIFYPPRDGDLPRDGNCPRDGDGDHHRYDNQ